MDSQLIHEFAEFKGETVSGLIRQAVITAVTGDYGCLVTDMLPETGAGRPD